jgi:hypothetical protein
LTVAAVQPAPVVDVGEEPTIPCACPFSVLGEEHDGVLYLAREPRLLYCGSCGVTLTVEACNRLHYLLSDLVCFRELLDHRLEPLDRQRADRGEASRQAARRALERRLLREYCEEDGDRGVRVATALNLDAPVGWQP